MCAAVLNESILKRAQEKGKVKIYVHDLREYTLDKHRKVDDRTFGGGSGMVMNAEPIFRAVEQIKVKSRSYTQHRTNKSNTPEAAFVLKSKVKSARQKPKVVLLCPQGKTFTQNSAKKLSTYTHLILICGHYEGVDERVRRFLVDEEISIGDYVLTGGELPAMVVVDAVTRLIPGVLGDKNSLNFESFEGNLLEYPQYTRPAEFRGHKVPPVLLSGDHKRIESWRQKEALRVTRLKRPDLLKRRNKNG
jgi:tRNA (guanine37-N1)-methyltransferase